ncbi:MAG: ABC transporter permease [Vicinamibacteria bacterium]|nr:ABC transporter permease [Vicinamibacteria bacterium]
MTPAAYTLWQREMVRFFRQPSRVIGAIGSPALFWLLLGSGFGQSFRPAASPLINGYLEYFYPGTLALIVLFTAIFSTVSIIEDRHEGFLQGVLAAPVSRIDIVTGKLLGAASLATMQATIFLVAAPFAVRPLTPEVVVQTIGVLAVLSIALGGLGFIVAWQFDSIQGFHAIMNLGLVPLWILSGAAFPATGAAPWVRVLMRANPLTYGVAALRHVLSPTPLAGEPSMSLCLLVVALFGIITLCLSIVLVRRDAR